MLQEQFAYSLDLCVGDAQQLACGVGVVGAARLYFVTQAEVMMQREGIEILSTTNASIEEISSRVLEHLGINRGMF